MKAEARTKAGAVFLTALFALGCDGPSDDGEGNGAPASKKDELHEAYGEMCGRYDSCLGYGAELVTACEMAYADNVETWYDQWSDDCVELLSERMACVSELDCADFEAFVGGKDESPTASYPCSEESNAAYAACWG